MKERIDYSKLRVVDTLKIQTVVITKNRSYFKSQLFLMILFLILLFNRYEFSIPLGSNIVFFVLLYKCIRYCVKREKFNFLPEPDKNYIEIPYKNKLRAIDAKVTCHPEANPVKIVQDESYRSYRLSNSSNSLIGSLK